MRFNPPVRRFTLVWGAALLLLSAASARAEQAYFPTPDAAVQALVDAVGAEGGEALRFVLGPEAAELGSGDPVADAAERQAFVEAAGAATRIEQQGDVLAELSIGADGWVFPIPLVKAAEGWYFDTAAGKEELLNRRIGANELHAIAVARAYVDAQYEYASRDRNGDGVREYAQRLKSSEGSRDGLYWPAVESEPESPLGPLVATAVAEGYGAVGNSGPQPYHGYFFRTLDGQGPHAPGGVRRFVRDGRMTEGFGLLAYPSVYGSSGVMTFIVNQQGIVFQKDLGADTEQTVAQITMYDPDRSWQPVSDPTD